MTRSQSSLSLLSAAEGSARVMGESFSLFLFFSFPTFQLRSLRTRFSRSTSIHAPLPRLAKRDDQGQTDERRLYSQATGDSTAVKDPKRFSFCLVGFYLMLSGNMGKDL